MPQYIDISVALETGIDSDPPGFRPEIEYLNHNDTVPDMLNFFPGLRKEDLRDGQSWALEWVRLSTHNGTHMDAPWHYHSTQDALLSGGPRRAMTIEEIPLEWCLRPGVKLDFRHFEDGYVVQPGDIKAELRRIGYTIAPLDIVLVNTRAGAMYGRDGYVSAGCGMGRQATMFLTEAGARIVGTDAWSWDAPFVHTAQKWASDRDPSIIWEGHKAGVDIGYCQLEKLHNLESIPPYGFEVSCFPVKVKNASAGWTRAVAIVR